LIIYAERNVAGDTIQMINAIAVDDEPIALDVIKNHAAKIPHLHLLNTFLSAMDALSFIKTNNVDLIFLDISMPDLSGIEFAGLVSREAQIVFTTAHPDYALKGFELAATDYLLKPINFNRFLQAVSLAGKRQKEGYVNSAKPESLFVKDGHNWIRIKFANLLYVQAEDNYVSLVERDRRTLTRTTMAEIQSKLPAGEFFRVHKSYIIALSKTDRIERHQVVINGAKIPLTMLSVGFLTEKINK
jgi:two-component system LytT family response regulator